MYCYNILNSFFIINVYHVMFSERIEDILVGNIEIVHFKRNVKTRLMLYISKQALVDANFFKFIETYMLYKQYD